VPATTRPGGTMTHEVAADEPGHVSTGQLPTPERARAFIDAAYARYREVADGTVAS
jgi:hypothetical protein